MWTDWAAVSRTIQARAQICCQQLVQSGYGAARAIQSMLPVHRHHRPNQQLAAHRLQMPATGMNWESSLQRSITQTHSLEVERARTDRLGWQPVSQSVTTTNLSINQLINKSIDQSFDHITVNKVCLPTMTLEWGASALNDRPRILYEVIDQNRPSTCNRQKHAPSRHLPHQTVPYHT